MGSDDSRFNVSLTVRGNDDHKSEAVFEEKESRGGIEQGYPFAYQPNTLPLGQTGSQVFGDSGVMSSCRADILGTNCVFGKWRNGLLFGIWKMCVFARKRLWRVRS